MRAERVKNKLDEFNLFNEAGDQIAKVLTSVNFKHFDDILASKDRLYLAMHLPLFKGPLCVEKLVVEDGSQLPPVDDKLLKTLERDIADYTRKNILMLIDGSSIDIGVKYGFKVHGELEYSNLFLVYKEINNFKEDMRRKVI